jgi:hypothetical protein
MSSPTTVTLTFTQTNNPIKSSMLEPLQKVDVPLFLSRKKHHSKKSIPSKKHKIPELDECSSQSSSSISVDSDKVPIWVVVIVKATTHDKTPSEVEAEGLLVDIRNSRDDQRANVVKLEKDIRQQMEFGIAYQMMGGCSDETEVYLQQASRLRHKLEVTLTAIAVLDMHILTLESEIQEAQSAHRSVDFSEQESFTQEMESILSGM